MIKKILFICDPLDTFKISTDTTYSLMLAANEATYHVYYSLPKDVYIEDTNVYCKCKRLSFNQYSYNHPDVLRPWYNEDDRVTVDIKSFYTILVRNDPPFNMEYYYLTQILKFAEESGIRVINNNYALRNFNEKLSILNFPDLITNTIVTKNYDAIDSFIEKHQECVIKPLDMMAGRSVFKISITDINYNVILETITNYYTQTVMVQKFIPDVVKGDKRIFVINGKVIEQCLHRIPQDNQIRGNIAAGGRGEVHKVSEQDYELAQKVAKWLKENNIVFAGLDVIGNYLTEINITSPTGARQILTATGINILKKIIDAL